MDDKYQKLYNQLISTGYKPEMLGSNADEFKENLRDVDKRDKLYNQLIGSGYKRSVLGNNSTEFADIMGLEDRPQATQPEQPKMTPEQQSAMIQGAHNVVSSAKLGGMQMKSQNEQAKKTPLALGTERQEIAFNPETNSFGTKFTTPEGQQTFNKDAADMVSLGYRQKMNGTVSAKLRNAEQRYDDVTKRMSERLDELREEHKPGLLQQMVGIQAADKLGGYQGENFEDWAEVRDDKEYQTLRLQANTLQKEIKGLRNAKDKEKDGTGFWDFFRNFGQTVTNVESWDFGKQALSDVNTMTNIARDYENGKQITPEQERALQELAELQYVENVYVADQGKWARWGDIAGMTPGFMKDFILTGGFGGLTTKLPVKAAEKVAVKMAKKGATNNLGKMVAKDGLTGFLRANGKGAMKKLFAEQGLDGIASIVTTKALGVGAEDFLLRAPLMTVTVQGMTTAANVVKDKLGDVVKDENGILHFKNEGTWTDTAWQSIMDNVVENYSEMWGSHLPGMADALKVLGARNLSAMVLKATREGAGTALSSVNTFMKRAGLNGYLGEVGEEYYGQLWRTMLGINTAYDNKGNNLLLDPQFHGDIWAGLAMSMGMTGAGAVAGSYSIKGAVNAASYLVNKHQVNKADKFARYYFPGEEWDGIKKTIDATNNAQIGNFVEGVKKDENLTDNQRNAIINYTGSLMAMRGYNLGEILRRKAGEKDSEQQQQEDNSYNDGYNATEPDERLEVRQRLDIVRHKVAKIFGIKDEDVDRSREQLDAALYDNYLDDNDKQIISDYLSQRAAYDGMIQRVQDDIDDKNAEISASVDTRVNPADGKLHPATTTDNREVFIIDGYATMFSDGTGIDSKNSSKSIVIFDPKTGKRDMIKPSQLISVGEEMLPEEVKQDAQTAAQEEISNKAASQIDGIIDYTPHTRYILRDEEGNDHDIEIQSLDDRNNIVNVSYDGIVYNMDKTVFEEGINRYRNETMADTMLQEEQEEYAATQPEQPEQPEQPAQQPTATEQIPELTKEKSEQTLKEIGGEDALNMRQYSVEEVTSSKNPNGKMSYVQALRFWKTLYSALKTEGMTKQHIHDIVRNMGLTFDATGYTALYKCLDAIQQGSLLPEDALKLFFTKSGDKGSGLRDEEIINSKILNNEPKRISENQKQATSPVVEQQKKQIPVDENGEPIYTQAEPETAYDAILEQADGNEEMALSAINTMLDLKKKALKDAQKAKPKAGNSMSEIIAAQKEHQAVIDSAQADLDAWNAIAGVRNARMQKLEEEKANAQVLNKRQAEADTAEQSRIAAEQAETALKAQQETAAAQAAQAAEASRQAQIRADEERETAAQKQKVIDDAVYSVKRRYEKQIKQSEIPDNLAGIIKNINAELNVIANLPKIFKDKETGEYTPKTKAKLDALREMLKLAIAKKVKLETPATDFERDRLIAEEIAKNEAEQKKVAEEKASQKAVALSKQREKELNAPPREEQVEEKTQDGRETLSNIYDKLGVEDAEEFIDANIKAVTKELNSVKKNKPKMSANLNQAVEDKKQWNEQKAALQADLDYWNDLKKQHEEMTHTAAVIKENEQSDFDEPHDALEFVASMLGGDNKITPEDYRAETGAGTEEQRQMVGFIAGKDKGGKTIITIAEEIQESGEGVQYGLKDEMQIRDAIIEVLQQGNPRTFIKKHREALAKELSEDEQNQLDTYAYGKMHMSGEDYLAYEEVMMPMILAKYNGFDEEEFLNRINIIEHETETADTETESTGNGTGSEVLQGEQPADTEGTEETETGDETGESGNSNAQPAENEPAEGTEPVKKPRKRKKGFGTLHPEYEKYKDMTADEYMQEKFEEKKKHLAEVGMPGETKDAVVNSSNLKEVFDKLADLIRKQKDVYNDWANRKYKKNNTSITVGDDELSSTHTNIGAVNERHRQQRMQNALNQINEYVDYGKSLLDYCDVHFEKQQARYKEICDELMSVLDDAKKTEPVKEEKKEEKKEEPKQETQKKYVYRLLIRPFSIGTQPDGGKYVDDGSKYGAVEYDHKLTDKEINNFSLLPVTEAKELVGKRLWRRLVHDNIIVDVTDVDDNGVVTYNITYGDSKETSKLSYKEFMERMADYKEGEPTEEKPVKKEKSEDISKDAENNVSLTIEEIDNADVDNYAKTLAKAYLQGNHGMAAQSGYLLVYNNVRNRTNNLAADSKTEDTTQSAPAVSANERGTGRRSGRQNNGQSGKTDEGTDATAVRGESKQDGKDINAVPAGEGSNINTGTEKTGTDRIPAGRTDTEGSNNTGTERTPVRKSEGTRIQREDTEHATGKEAELNGQINDCIEEFNDLLDQFEKAGSESLSISLVGMNPKQIEIVFKMVKVGAELGYRYIQKGVCKFEQWLDAMRNKMAEPLSKVLKISDAEIDEFIKEMWDCPYSVNNQVHTIGEWASVIGQENLRNQIRASFEDKEQAQNAAEDIPVKLNDADNIADTLPYLFPQQQEDVLRAENQFFSKEHQDRAHGFGKGYMFTNGTGTGKTLTGLGIIKRFIKSGKGRVLIVTPTQTKVRDWCQEARNLNIEATPLTGIDDKGTGVVVTTFANFRQNSVITSDVFDLIVYDESHRIMESKTANETVCYDQHLMMSNKNDKEALKRMKLHDAFFIKLRKAEDEYKELADEVKTELAKGNPVSEKKKDKIKKLELQLAQMRNRVDAEEKRLLPAAKEAVKKTKVVFLSATPFNTVDNMQYAEGYIFSYPEENKNTIGSYRHRTPKEEFLEQFFGAGYQFRYGRLEKHVENPEALSQQEVQFSDYLENELQTKSGRIINSDYDYSRDFPTVTLNFAPLFNSALEKVFRNVKYQPLSDAFYKVFFDYNFSTALFEAMKISAIAPRIKKHLAMGRKVVIYHRRKTTKIPLQPPFELALEEAEIMAKNSNNKEERKAVADAIANFRKEYARLLDYEQRLDYSLPREQIAKIFGEDKVLFFSGDETKKEKNAAVDEFNNDDSEKKIMVVQESSGKEGISLHDTTGKHQRVLINLSLPQSPITVLQIEGRIYRIGNMSNAIFEYPLLGLDLETTLFAQKFNNQVSTTENLALGSKARNLRASFADGVMENSGDIPLEGQGIGGKEFDNRGKDDVNEFDKSILDFYGTEKMRQKRSERPGVDFYPTPEPVGYKMVEWGGITEGESVLEPSAGRGAIARYVPRTNNLVAIEPSSDLHSQLQLKVGGVGRKILSIPFENFDKINKFDVVLMNPPFGAGGRTAIDHVAKAFGHLNEGGRVIALIPRGSTDSKFDKWYEAQKDAVMVGEVDLPAVTFSRAGTSVSTRIVVIDKVSRQETQSKAAANAEHIDLSYIEELEGEDGLFEALRNISMPERIDDVVIKSMKQARKTGKEFRDNDIVRSVNVDEEGITVHTNGIGSFHMNWNDVESVKQGNDYVKRGFLDKWKFYKRGFINYSHLAETSPRTKRYAKTANFDATCMKTIENVLGMTTDEMEAATSDDDTRFRTSDELNEEYPTWLSGQTRATGQHTTQIKSTVNTYRKIGNWLSENGYKGARILDASSGLGLGTQALREMGFDVEDVEPYPSEKREAPTYSNYDDINGTYDVVISNAVLNVIPDDWRTNVLHQMADKVADGGMMIINVRDAKEIEKQKQKIELDTPSEILVTDKNGNIQAYQKGFTQKELTDYIQKELGDGWTVKTANKNNSGISGRAVIAVKGQNLSMRTGEGPVTDADISHANDPYWKMTGKDRTKQQQREFARRERQRMRTRIDELVERLHLDNVNVLEDGSTLTGKKAKAKGFFSISNGKITIVLSNHTSVEDVERTLLHEAVAHYGLRRLFGEQFDTFLDNVYEAASIEIRHKIADMAQWNNWNIREATEEYLASLAEDTEFENVNATWWNKIKGWFLDMLHKIGFKDFDTNGRIIGDNEMRYLLWRSYQNLKNPGRFKNILGMSEDITKQMDLKVGNYAPKPAMTSKVVSEPEINETKRFTPKYQLDSNKDYHVRFASDMESDMKRGWSSWNYGNIVKEGSVDDVIDWLNEYRGDNIDLGFGETWIDEDAEIYKDEKSIIINSGNDTYELKEFKPNEWAVVDNDNAEGALSSHYLPNDNLNTIQDALDYIKANKGRYDGVGDGEHFDADNSRVVYESEPDKDGMRMYIIEEGAENPDKIVSKGYAPKPAMVGETVQDSEQERQSIIMEARANGTYLKAPNGKNTNLTPEQWVQVRTKAFKNWFGDWENDPENASKVVDENGEPLVVYHGTSKAGFTVFKIGEMGIWFTSSRKDADSYGGNAEGKLFSPSEKEQKEVVNVGNYELADGMVFDTEKELEDFKKKYPSYSEYMSDKDIDEALDNIDYLDDENAGKKENKLELIRRKSHDIRSAYNKYTYNKLYKTTVGDIVKNYKQYTKTDLERAVYALDSNAYLDDIEDMDEEDAKEALVEVINNYDEEAKENGASSVMDITLRARAKRNSSVALSKPINNRTYAAFINLRTPFESDGKGHSMPSNHFYDKWNDAREEGKYDGALLKNTTVGRYQENGDVIIATEPNQIKSATDNNGDFDSDNDDIRFRTDEDGMPPLKVKRTAPSGIAFNEYNDAINRQINDNASRKERMKASLHNFGYKFIEAYFDSMNSLKKLQKAISDETGKPIKDSENAYMAENRMSSQNYQECKAYLRDYIEPLEQEIYRLIEQGGTREDVNNYLMAKHGLERNEVFRKRDAQKHADKWEENSISLKQREFKQEVNNVESSLRYHQTKLQKKVDAGEITQSEMNRQLAVKEKERDERVQEATETLREQLKKIAEKKNKVYSDKLEKLKDVDYSGLTELTLEDDEELDSNKDYTERAERIVDEYESTHKTDNIWSLINAATKETLRKDFLSGNLTKANYEYIRDMFEYYVPLRGWDNNKAEDVYEYIDSTRMHMSESSAVKKAKGRRSKADDVVAFIAFIGNGTIIGGNRNLMKQHLLRFVMNNPTDLARADRQWYVYNDVMDTWVEQFPEEDESYDEFEERMKSYGDRAKQIILSLNTGMHITAAQANEHTVKVKMNGEQFTVNINGNPRAANAMNGMLNPDNSGGILGTKAVRAMQTVKNFMASVFTAKNPAFIFSNLAKDMLFTNFAVSVKESKEYKKQYHKNIVDILKHGYTYKFIKKSEKERLGGGSEIEKYFNEFLSNGGETGYTNYVNVEEFKRDIEKSIKKLQKGEPIAKKEWHKFWQSVEICNRAIEDMTRFGIYVTSRQSGRTIERSIFDAKEITVNFNKKGSGFMGAKFFNFAYIFFNATIQSISNFVRLAYNNPKQFAKRTGLYVAYGFAFPILSMLSCMLFGGDDDDYYDLPDWVRENNFIIHMPFSKHKFITIPIPYELRGFYAIGENALATLMRKQTPENGLTHSMMAFSSMFPLDLTGNNMNPVINFTPTVFQPFAQIDRNTDFFGKPIYKDSEYMKQYPEWRKAYGGTSPILVNMSKYLNELGGGDNVKSSALDVNPAWVEHVMENYLGGPAKFINQICKTISMPWNEDVRELRNVPVLYRFLQSADEKTTGSNTNQIYSDLVKEYDQMQHLQSGYLQEIKKGDEEYKDLYKELFEDDDFGKRFYLMKGYINTINSMYDVKKLVLPEQQEEIDKKILEMKKEMISKYDEIGKGRK